MGFKHRFNQGFFGAAPHAGRVSLAYYDIGLGGRGYMLDFTAQGDSGYGFQTIPKLRSGQINQPVNDGERSLNADDYWRKSADSWHLGAGQKFFDHDNSDERRFRYSKGCYVWEPGELSLLNDTTLADDQAAEVKAVVAGQALYQLTSALRYTTDLSVYSTVTAAGGDAALSSPVDMATDGYTVWVADATRVHYTLRGAGTFTKYHTSDHVADLIRSVKGRLLTGKDNVLYTHSGTAGAAVATALFTHPNPDWTWTDFAGGQNAIYAAGYSGDKSIIYRTAVEADGTDLAIPSAAAELPDGEIVRSLHAYLSILLIGTDTGVRIAQMGGDGTLTLGNLIDTDTSVRCFEPQGRFVWFGWSNFDNDSTGLGRLDLSTFVVDAPAYASDLMAATSGIVTSVATFANKRVFTVSGSGLWAENLTSKVATGTLYSGWANFGIGDPKLAVRFLAQWRAGDGTFTVQISTDGGDYLGLGATVATGDSGDDTTLPVSLKSGREFEWLLTLTRDTDDATSSSVLSRVTLMVNPTPARRLIVTLPLQLHKSQVSRSRQRFTTDTSGERAFIAGLWQSGQVVAYDDPGARYNVTIEDFRWVPYLQPGRSDQWDGTLVVQAKVND